MIRPYVQGDLAQVIELVQQGPLLAKDEIADLVTQRESWVDCADGAIRGVMALAEFPDAYGLRIYVGPNWRRRGIGSALYDHVLPRLAAGGPARVHTSYRCDKGGEGAHFFASRGFAPWYGMTHLSYAGPAHSVPAVDIRPYSDPLFATYIRVLGRSFAKMRADHGFAPYDVEEMHNTTETRTDFAGRAADLYLAFADDGEPAGCADVRGDYIDTIGVLPGYQGRGLGRALTKHCINLVLARGYAAARTSVVTDNLPAMRLYLDLGFSVTEADEIAALVIKR